MTLLPRRARGWGSDPVPGTVAQPFRIVALHDHGVDAEARHLQHRDRLARGHTRPRCVHVRRELVLTVAVPELLDRALEERDGHRDRDDCHQRDGDAVAPSRGARRRVRSLVRLGHEVVDAGLDGLRRLVGAQERHGARLARSLRTGLRKRK